MNQKSQDILQWIPQRIPFVMVDELVSCTEEATISSFKIRKENIFFNGVDIEEVALVENIAQTAAARVGFMSVQENKPVPVGFIGAVQQLKIHRKPLLHEVLETKIIVKNQIFNASIIEGVITINDEKIASCEMKIFIQAN